MFVPASEHERGELGAAWPSQGVLRLCRRILPRAKAARRLEAGGPGESPFPPPERFLFTGWGWKPNYRGVSPEVVQNSGGAFLGEEADSTGAKKLLK